MHKHKSRAVQHAGTAHKAPTAASSRTTTCHIKTIQHQLKRWKTMSLILKERARCHRRPSATAGRPRRHMRGAGRVSGESARTDRRRLARPSS